MRSGLLTQRIVHNRTGLVYLAGIKIDTSSRISRAVNIPGHRAVENCQPCAEKLHIPQREENTALFKQGTCVKKAYSAVVEVGVDSIAGPATA